MSLQGSFVSTSKLTVVTSKLLLRSAFRLWRRRILVDHEQVSLQRGLV